MVGLKSVWISLSALFLLASCVPQTKQTSCGENENYNTTLRTCVPTTQSPSSFITISSFIPTNSYSRYKNDLTPMTFRVNVSNPYAQSYTTRWLHTFNGNSTDVTGFITSPTQWDIYPMFFVNEVGLHLLTVDILDSSSNIVTTHAFQFTINNSPRPFINTTSISPASYDISPVYPTSGSQTFSFVVKNNNASIPSTSTYNVQWKLYKNGIDTALVAPNSATDSLADISGTGSNTFDTVFDPSVLTGYGLGTYILRARVMYVPGAEIVDERQWSITVQNPPLPKITSRTLSLSDPQLDSALTVVNAYTGIDYTQNTVYNFRPLRFEASTTTALTLWGASQANFCVRVADGSGTFPGDGLGVKVSWMIDGTGAAIYEGTTTPGDPEVCLSDVTNLTPEQIVFNNTIATSTESHTIIARVYDEATQTEYSTTNMATGTSTYPITWKVKVFPQNAPPKITFGLTSSGISCTVIGSIVRSNCTVASDTDIIVSARVNYDDFYVLPAYDETKFDYSVKLYQNNVEFSECTKSIAGTDGLTDGGGPEYVCAFQAPSYNASGPVNPTTQSYKVVATVTDNQSEIVVSTTTSNTLTWNLKVTEGNSTPSISSFTSNGPVDEGTNLQFSVDVDDAERDNFTYQIRYCTNDACSTSLPLTTTATATRTTDDLTKTVATSTFLTESFLSNVSGVTGCSNLARNASCNVQFFVVVNETGQSSGVTPGKLPLTTVPVPGDLLTVSIENINPPPTMAEASFSPTAEITLATPDYSLLVGIPFTISAPVGSALNDTSAVAGEKINRYQWFVKNANSVTTWTAINGATSPNLLWTPSLIDEAEISNDNPIQVKLCVEDRSTAVVASPLTEATAALCSDDVLAAFTTTGIWQFTVRNNVVTAQDLTNTATDTSMATISAEVGIETATWIEPTPTTTNGVTSSATYIAYADNVAAYDPDGDFITEDDIYITVKKVLVKNNGELLPETATKIARFKGLPVALTSNVKDMSITGTVDGSGNPLSLYIAYRASSTSAPSAYYPQVRRIEIVGVKTAPNEHSGILGFAYTGFSLTNNCTLAASCVFGVSGDYQTVNFSDATVTGNISVVSNFNTRIYAFASLATKTVTEICSDCNGNGKASTFAAAINADTTLAGMGITATFAANIVTIQGMTSGDFYDGSATDVQVSDDMGEIYVADFDTDPTPAVSLAPYWNLPFINSSVGSTNKDKLSVISGPIDVNIGTNSASLELTTAATNTSLAATVALNNVSTYFNGTDLYVAGLAKSGSTLKLYILDPADFTIAVSNTAAMSGTAHTDVEVSANTSNVYVMTTTNETPVKNEIGVYSATTLAESDKFKLSDTVNVDSASMALFYNTVTGSTIKSYKLIPYNGEARLVAVADNGTTTQLYLARLYSNGTDYLLTCKDCVQVTNTINEVSEFVKVNASHVRSKPVIPSTNFTLSSGGAATYKDIFVTSFAGSPTGGTITSSPNVGVFNMEIENINTSILPTVNEDAGLYRPPFFKN